VVEAFLRIPAERWGTIRLDVIERIRSEQVRTGGYKF
jgi:hypothetical protein